MAQLDRASVYGTEGCWFESGWAHFFLPIIARILLLRYPFLYMYCTGGSYVYISKRVLC